MATRRESSSGSVDTISSLPEEVLAHILSFLPTKRAASTSILSKRWRNLFQLMNRLCASLCFDDSDLLYPDRERGDIQDCFRNFVDKMLSSSCNSLKKFSLNCQDELHHTARTRGWISKALERGVSDLDLRVKMPLRYKPPSLLPQTIFINNTLVKLTLGTERCLGSAPLQEVDLPLLKSLSLHTVWFSDEDLCDVMISGCPALEELYIHYIYIEDRKRRFDIQPAPYYLEHDNIKRLTVRYNDDVQHPRSLLFFTRNLIYLDYSDFLTCEYESSADVFDALLEARLNLGFCRGGRWPDEHENCSKLMSYICSVQTLYLSSSTVKVMYKCLDYWHNHEGFPFFKNLVTLHFESNREEYWKVLTNMIERSPKLEVLVLKGLCGISDCEVVNIGGNVVKVVEIQGYKGRLGELNQVKCFLWEMENLEEMKVKISDEIEDKLQLTNDLLALPKRSSRCSIHIL